MSEGNAGGHEAAHAANEGADAKTTAMTQQMVEMILQRLQSHTERSELLAEIDKLKYKFGYQAAVNQLLRKRLIESKTEKHNLEREVEEHMATIDNLQRLLREAYAKNSNTARDNRASGHEERVIVCVRCFQKQLPCDNDRDCRECQIHNKTCRRTECPRFARGLFKRRHCTRAHEEDHGRFNAPGAKPYRFSKVAVLPRKRKRSEP